jgi:hypothetical protein
VIGAIRVNRGQRHAGRVDLLKVRKLFSDPEKILLSQLRLFEVRVGPSPQKKKPGHLFGVRKPSRHLGERANRLFERLAIFRVGLLMHSHAKLEFRALMLEIPQLEQQHLLALQSKSKALGALELIQRGLDRPIDFSESGSVHQPVDLFLFR